MSEKNNAIAWYDLALVYFCGRGVERNFDEACRLIKKSASEGCEEAKELVSVIDGKSEKDACAEIVRTTGFDPEGGTLLPNVSEKDVSVYKETLVAAINGRGEASLKLADMYAVGKSPVAKSSIVALRWYRRAHIMGGRDAALLLGISLWENGREDAALVLKKAVEDGCKDAKYYLGECLYHGLGVKQDFEQAALIFEEAASEGNADAQCALGCCYFRGEGVGKNIKEGISLLHKAENAGCVRAKIELASISDEVEKVQGDLLDATIKGADNGDAESQLELAEKYATGDGVDEDFVKAAEWYRKAFENEDAPVEVKSKAGLELATAFIDGRGVGKDGLEAVKILLAAEEATADASVQCMLGGMYLNLSGDSLIEPDFDRGFAYFKKAAEQGEATAEFGLGACYAQGWGTAKDVDAARRWFARAATHGQKEALQSFNEQGVTEIPDEFRNKDATDADLTKYKELKEKALAGDSEAQYELAEAYYYGRDGAIENESEAVRWYRKSAAQNNSDAIYSMGICYYKGQGVEESNDRAFYWFQKGAFLENIDAEYMTGICNLNGYGTEVNEKLADFWFERAAEKGHAKAMRQMGDGHRRGRGILKKDDVKALEWYKRAAEKDDPVAQYWLAEFHECGRGGLAVDLEESFAWRLSSAKNGDVDSMNCVGWAYQKGLGTEVDAEKAVEWYAKAVEEGSAKAMNNLAKCYEDAFGVEQDLYKAFDLFTQSAEKGFSRGCYHLGRFYENGICVDVDMAKAKEWYQKAADKGEKDAKDALERLG